MVEIATSPTTATEKKDLKAEVYVYIGTVYNLSCLIILLYIQTSTGFDDYKTQTHGKLSGILDDI